jgi:hypothetical protein
MEVIGEPLEEIEIEKETVDLDEVEMTGAIEIAKMIEVSLQK